MLYTLLAFFLFVIPLFFWNGWGDGIRFPKENLSIIGFLAVIGLSFFYYHLKPFKHKWLILFGGWCFLTTIVNYYMIPVYLTKVVIEMPAPFIAYKELFYITLSITAVICISSVLPKNRKLIDTGLFEINFNEALNIQSIAKVVSWCVIVMSIYSFIQILGFDQIFRCADINTKWIAQNPLTGNKDFTGDVIRRTVGTVGNPSILAMWIAICLPLCLYLRQKTGYIAFLMGLIIIAVTMSATAIVGAVTGVLLYLYFNHKKILLGLIIISIPITFCISGNDVIHQKVKHLLDPTGRVECHKEAWKMIAERPLFGMGLGSFEYLIGNNPDVVNRLKNENWKELHDEYGQIWFTTGLVGLSIFLCFLVGAIRKFLKNITDESSVLFASLVAFMVMSMGYFTMRVAPISFYGVILLGLFLNKIGEGNG